MIHESRYWKAPLLDAKKRLLAVAEPGELSEEHLAQIERDLFIGFYAIRKLLDAPGKLSDATHAMTVSLEWHPNRVSVTQRNSRQNR